MDARAVIATLVFGACLYGTFTFIWSPPHFLHLMFLTVWACVAFALTLNRLVCGRRAAFVLADSTSRARIRDILSGRPQEMA